MKIKGFFKWMFIGLFILVGLVGVFWIISTLYSHLIENSPENKRKREIESLQQDYIEYKEIFESVIPLFPYGEYSKISSSDYDKENESLVIIFEELKYVEIYADFLGNVYFNKFTPWVFDGLVYAKVPEYVFDYDASGAVFSNNGELNYIEKPNDMIRYMEKNNILDGSGIWAICYRPWM